jgi:tRNA-splicing ligase RtcB
MASQFIHNVRVWGIPDPDSVQQMVRCAVEGSTKRACLMADHHKGYSQPIGGVLAYRDMVSPSGVGYDIACGNKAVRTTLKIEDVRASIPALADRIAQNIEFGIGRKNPKPVDHPLFESATWKEVPQLQSLKDLARRQLGTVGAGNHYVDVFVEEATGDVWIGVHFGSRGFGHKTASGFLNLAHGRKFDDKPRGDSMDQLPTLIPAHSPLGEAYTAAMKLAGKYAYAGRDHVVDHVLELLGTRETYTVHNHHNFAWKERHEGEEVYVIRKGATPCFPGQESFIGGSMGDISVIVAGRDGKEARQALYSTVHGAGRIMSRTQAAGKMNWRKKRRTGGAISPERMSRAVRDFGVELRGGGPDEAPFVYRKLREVLAAHAESLHILHVLRPVIVVMAGEDEYDPFRD